MSLTTYPLFQHAYLVNDLDQAITHWHTLFGAGPFVKAEHHKTDRFDYRGTDQEADVSYAFGYLGDMQIQFIVQHDDTPSIYRDMFEPGQEGFHHLGCLVHDFEAEFSRLESLGFDRFGIRHVASSAREHEAGRQPVHGSQQGPRKGPGLTKLGNGSETGLGHAAQAVIDIEVFELRWGDPTHALALVVRCELSAIGGNDQVAHIEMKMSVFLGRVHFVDVHIDRKPPLQLGVEEHEAGVAAGIYHEGRTGQMTRSTRA